MSSPRRTFRGAESPEFAPPTIVKSLPARRCARIAVFIAAIAVPPFARGGHDGVWRVTWSNDAEPICANAVPAPRRTLAGVALLVVGMVGLGSQPAAHNRISQVTWTTDVEPIMKARCLGLSHHGRVRTDVAGDLSTGAYVGEGHSRKRCSTGGCPRGLPREVLGSPARSSAAYRRQRPKSV